MRSSSPCLRGLGAWALLVSLSAPSAGCATIFRGTKATVVVASDPEGATAEIPKTDPLETPSEARISRKGMTPVTLRKQGYAEHRGLVKKKVNGLWLTYDILSCGFALCLPLIVDAISGAWIDVSPYSATLARPEEPRASQAPVAVVPAPRPVESAPPAPAMPTATLSESERKATARAAYAEGIELQGKNDCASALPKFEVAEKMFSAPTHLLHIGQCQASLGRLVEASETYETLTRKSLGEGAPEAFRHAQEDGKKALAEVKPRVPTLRVQVTPAPSSLQGLVVRVNGAPMPIELIGIARPVNPGTYKVTAEARGAKPATAEAAVPEGASKTLDLKLAR